MPEVTKTPRGNKERMSILDSMVFGESIVIDFDSVSRWRTTANANGIHIATRRIDINHSMLIKVATRQYKRLRDRILNPVTMSNANIKYGLIYPEQNDDIL